MSPIVISVNQLARHFPSKAIESCFNRVCVSGGIRDVLPTSSMAQTSHYTFYRPFYFVFIGTVNA